ncbi:hypothetical protein BN871_FV_00060 [Paenibacillus sp. P22]|nr:hypothetical protein BN871_FV_00060 [Paenibacillus sp. P22]
MAIPHYHSAWVGQRIQQLDEQSAAGITIDRMSSSCIIQVYTFIIQLV